MMTHALPFPGQPQPFQTVEFREGSFAGVADSRCRMTCWDTSVFCPDGSRLLGQSSLTDRRAGRLYSSRIDPILQQQPQNREHVMTRDQTHQSASLHHR